MTGGTPLEVFERKKEIKFWQWEMFMVLANPDAQKKQKSMKVADAHELLLDIFRIQEHPNEMIKKTVRKAETMVFLELLEEMEDEDGKVPLYKGGRFVKIEDVPKVDYNETKNAE